MKQQRKILPLLGALLAIFAAWRWQIAEHWAVLAAGVLLIMACLLLFGTFRQTRATGEYLLAFALLGMMALLVPAWAVLIPVLLLGCTLLQSLSPRAFLASLIGLATPLWILFGALFVLDRQYHFQFITSRFFRFYAIDYTSLTIPQLAALALMAVGGIPALVRFPQTAHLLRTHIRVRYLFLVCLFVGALLYLLLQPTRFDVLIPLLLMVPAFFFGEEWRLTKTHWKEKTYHVVLLLLLGAYLSLPLWIS